MEYILPIGLTLTVLCSIIYIVSKITSNKVRRESMSKLKHRQSTIHNIVQSILPTNEEIIKSIIINRERSKQKKQSGQSYNPESIKVVVIENKAYWIQNNTFYETIVTDDGEIDQSLAKPVDTTNMDVEEIDRLMKIVDDLRSAERNDGGSTGN